MGQVRVDKEGIARREQQIAGWSKQVEVWMAMCEKSPQLDILRRATELSITAIKRDIDERVKTLSFATVPDQLDLAKLRGKLDGIESVYYDIADAPKKIEQAKLIIAKLVEENKRAKKGELINAGV